MKADVPTDLGGRLFGCSHRATLISETLAGWAIALQDFVPSEGSLRGLRDVAEELADEIEAVNRAYSAACDRRKTETS